ncbi:hypothetical protein FHX64_001553 [Microbacter margulisiae]|uniref:Uncharacterized protein n=1 Tax=Microbacter margulisiae TaxID=1350067 RepID=A0A7W5DQT3_9PORP|nr:hypothetical protein [Microbacter margulisiae]
MGLLQVRRSRLCIWMSECHFFCRKILLSSKTAVLLWYANSYAGVFSCIFRYVMLRFIWTGESMILLSIFIAMQLPVAANVLWYSLFRLHG